MLNRRFFVSDPWGSASFLTHRFRLRFRLNPFYALSGRLQNRLSFSPGKYQTRHGECRALAHLAFRIDGSTQCFDLGFDPEYTPHPAHLCDREKFCEDRIAYRRIYPFQCPVRYRARSIPPNGCACGWHSYFRRPIGRAVFDGVAEQVFEKYFPGRCASNE